MTPILQGPVTASQASCYLNQPSLKVLQLLLILMAFEAVRILLEKAITAAWLSGPPGCLSLVLLQKGRGALSHQLGPT